MKALPDPLSFFRLKSVRAARVSEISEATAAADVPLEEQINFHIGNPLQDSTLSSKFLRIALGIDSQRQDLMDNTPDQIFEYLGWKEHERPKLEFLINVIQKSIPYMPRGGYSRKSPHRLIKAFCTWLEKQQEPLEYDLGEQSGRREIILASGGIREALRVILHALSNGLQITPATIFCYQLELTVNENSFPKLRIVHLPDDERTALDQLEKFFSLPATTPTFLLIGNSLGEETRRKLRLLSIQVPLFFIEANNAPNHHSLAREAKLIQRVIRLLTPAVFDTRLRNLSPVFVAGNADILSVVENVHFQLKGTPSASEVELLSFLLDQKIVERENGGKENASSDQIYYEEPGIGNSAENALFKLSLRLGAQFDQWLSDGSQTTAHLVGALNRISSTSNRIIEHQKKANLYDELAGLDTHQLLVQLMDNAHDPVWCQALERSFLSAFLKHQPQYQPEACQVTSGSSRTALGILGFHCGITDVVIADLSWSYEQCFPNVHVVPLTDQLELDVDGIIKKIEQLCQDDPDWPEHGALVINNPHNATGRIFSENAVRKLLVYCLERSIYVIDDLAYQYVAPVQGLPQIKSARQIAIDMVFSGSLSRERSDRLITIHSISKTDCLAGARLAVVEIQVQELRQRYVKINSQIRQNLAAIFISYLFYRASLQEVRSYWSLRNEIFLKRTQALLTAHENIPADRNIFDLSIIPPAGSMYPLLRIGRLPAGLSLDWLASGLARRGIGLLPLATFARTGKGFDTGRRMFRLTLGGSDNADVLLVKTRLLLIDLNRVIAEEDARYNRKLLPILKPNNSGDNSAERLKQWDRVTRLIQQQINFNRELRHIANGPSIDLKHVQAEFEKQYLPDRLEIFRTRLLDRSLLSDEMLHRAMSDNGNWLTGHLESEFMKDSLERRRDFFLKRSYDRTVHPTQRYSIQTEMAFDVILRQLIYRQPVSLSLIRGAAQEILREFLALNVAISSQNEGSEIILDIDALVAAEAYTEMFSSTTLFPLLSFWSDWDGSNRPSGQGHCLIASIVMENVRRMAGILGSLKLSDPTIEINPDLAEKLVHLPERSKEFSNLLNDITLLTQQLEQRYRGILPLSVNALPSRRLSSMLNFRRDPTRLLWQHNDRYERNMLELRRQRRDMLETYFSLNKQLRKQLYALIPAIRSNRAKENLLREVVDYRDLLQRVVITPRIHEGMIIARDPFTINTTVHNIQEINSICGKYSNPGMVLGLQVSFASRPEALISLDRKMKLQTEEARREYPTADLPNICLIPLFENQETLVNITSYLDRIWDYATASRHADQTTQNRFSEIITEVFIAGSDLSQELSQAHAADQYYRAKYSLQVWLAEHGVTEAVRIKLGSGEAMQRQGAYFSPFAGQFAFLNSQKKQSRLIAHLPEAARRSTAYAVSPLQGVFVGGDLRTIQSCLSEQLRGLPTPELSNVLYHLRETQKVHRDNLVRAAETIAESRLRARGRSIQELERLTIGSNEAVYTGFLQELTSHFRHILYGRAEDVVGIHVISYFIARSMPQLRDRPTSRLLASLGSDQRQQILANIAEIIPLEKQGSLLRAIAHNQAQTAVLGINQLTTGLFRALDYYAQKAFPVAERESMIAERILPLLPVYEILHSLRIYQDWKGEFINQIEPAFPAGHSAFVALREDQAAMYRFLPLFQQELLRRHGLNVNDFIADGVFIQELLPTVRPDLAVLLQKNLFNTSTEQIFSSLHGSLDGEWQSQVSQFLRIPEQVYYWRKMIWEVISESIFQRVQSFTELATSLYSFSSTHSSELASTGVQLPKLSSALSGFIHTARADDEMRQFLVSAVEYLSTFTEGKVEIPVSIIRALNDVERIAKIEESALPPEKKVLLRWAMLQIARVAGDNG
jgi:aspartate/methionine/tyrosine aminotransferase